MKFNYLSVLLVCLLFLCSACNNKPQANKIQIYLVKVNPFKKVEIKQVQRDFDGNNPKLKDIILSLLSELKPNEKNRGYGTEIPTGTRLLWIEELPNQIKINLSSNFAEGGGSQSMLLRYTQLEKTINYKCPLKPVFVFVEGKQVKTLGGEGLVVKQPINTKF